MIEVNLITGRTIEQGASMEISKLSDEYTKATAICELDSEDMTQLGIKDGDNVKVSSVAGSVIVKARNATQGPHKGMAFIPMGPWANSITGTGSDSTGMPPFKGIDVKIEEAKAEKVLSARELIEEVYRGI
ncbi:molybdopterin dinucleotide-binding protein [archaeon]|nr:molybdopterin dinucleotide-binding protein [archaeon]